MVYLLGAEESDILSFLSSPECLLIRTGTKYMSFTLERTIPSIFGLALLLLAVIGGALYRSVLHTQESLDWEAHTREVQLHLEKMQSALAELESSTRGFAIMGESDFLQTFDRNVSSFRTELKLLRDLTTDDAAQQQRLASIQSLGEEKIAVSQTILDFRRANGEDSALAIIRAGKGKSLMDQMRPLVNEVQQEESRLFAERRATLQTQLRWTSTIILASSILGILSLACANLVVVRQLNRRRKADISLAQANALLEQRVEEQSKSLSKTSDELKLEHIRRGLAEKKEREQREWWRVTLNSIGDGVITTDTEGKINFINQIAQDTTGWKLEDAIGLPLEQVFNIFNEQTLQPVESPISKVLHEGVTVGLANHTSLLTKDKRYLPIDDSGAPIRDDDGNIIGAVLVFRDFSQQRQSETKLRRAEEMQRLALNAGKMGVFAWNLQSDVVELDARTQALFGQDQTENPTTAAPIFAVIYDEDRPALDQHIKDTVEKKIPYDTRFRVKLPDGRTRWLAGVGSVDLDAQTGATILRGINYDITEQVEAEEELRRREQHLRNVLDSLFSFVGVMLPDGTLIEANRTALEAASLQASDVIGKHFADTYWWAYSPDVQVQLRDAIQRARMGERVRYDVTVRLGETTFIPIDFMLVPLFDEQGQVTHLVPSGLDLSPRREAELKLRESEQFNRGIFENSPDCVKILELDGTLHAMNSNGLCLMEIDDFSCFVGEKWVDFWPEEYRELARRAVQSAATGTPDSFQGFCPTAKGTPKWWDVSVAPILNAEGRPVRLISTSRDITERKEQENALRVNEIRFRTLTETIPQLVWTCRPDGYCGYLSNRWMEYTGTTLEQNLGYGWLRVVHPDDAAKTQEVWEHAVATSDTYQTEFRLRRADGVYRWHLSRALRVSDEMGNTVKWFGTSTDIEDHKQAEAERLEMLEREQVLRSKAEEANRLKDEFVATVSHELRTPLNAILGWARMMRAGTLDEMTTRKAVEVIERSAETQARLIDDLLDMSRIITGKLRLDLKTLDPATVVRAALETVLPTARAKDITIQSDFDPQVNGIVGDANRLQQVAWNLLSNAIKFTPKNGHIHVRLTTENSQAVIIVRDSGQGIAPEFLPYVFDRFRQADASSIRKHGGLGLGLSIARHLIELHGGTITVESKGENQGATFTVRLPILPVQMPNVRSDAESAAPINLPAPNTEAILSGLFILAVDDEPDARQLLAQILTAYGATVTTTDNAESALEIIKQQQPDLLVSDIGMPNKDGYSLIRRVREFEHGNARRTPAIALTAYARPRDRMQALAAGFNHHVPKPVEPAELVTVITSLTGRLELSDA